MRLIEEATNPYELLIIEANRKKITLPEFVKSVKPMQRDDGNWIHWWRRVHTLPSVKEKA